jgi:hypothetical protein
MAESFFASLKRELVDDEHFATRAEARAAVFEWLIWYNSDRLHSALQYRPPVEYEQHVISNQQQAECPLRWGSSWEPFCTVWCREGVWVWGSGLTCF